jgi:hypothetical protein
MSVDLTPTADARPMSREEYEQWVAEATVHEHEVKAGLKEVRGGLWRAAKALYAFNEEVGWQALGYDTLGEWLGNPDVTLARSTYYRLLSAWHEFHVLRKIDEDTLKTLDLTKAAISLPALKRGEATVEEVMADVEALGARDMRVKYTHVPDEQVVGVQTDADDNADDDGPNVETEDEQPGDFSPAELYEDPDTQYGTEMVPRGVAETLVAVLEAVLREVGAPERKAMSKRLREQVAYALELAQAEGLGGL